jgi:hypothetical protein
MSQRMKVVSWSALLGAGMSLPLGARAEPLPQIPLHQVALSGYDSGPVEASPDGEPVQVVYSTLVRVSGAAWVRLSFGDVALAGDPAADGAVIRVRSTLDGGVQYLNAESLAQWGFTSAYFNGESVEVDLVAFAGTDESRLEMTSVTAGDTAVFTSRSLCGVDDRTPSTERASARILPTGCTGFIFNDANRTMLTAGHCGVNVTTVVQFNVPPSTAGGTIVNPPPQDQYAVDPASVQFNDGGLGNDWTYFGCFPNSNSGLTPYQAQGQLQVLAAHPPSPAWQSLRISGYGLVSPPMPMTLNETLTTSTGPFTGWAGNVLNYQVDTTGGDSGSAVVNTVTGQVIGIHTNAGCNGDGSGANQGSAIDTPALQTALANPRGVCATGGGGGGGSGNLFIATDVSNNIGTLTTGSGAFHAVAQTQPSMQGLAYDRNTDRFIGIDSSRNVYTIHPQTGQTILVGNAVGTTQTINGLGYDPDARVLYGMAQANGQLYVISMTAMIVQPIGSPQGGSMGGMDFDRVNHVLYGIDDAAGGSRLVRVNTTTGAWTAIGPLGAGATDCNGLAFNPLDRRLYTVNAPTGQLLSINPATGVATVAGATGGVFGAGFGMAAREVTLTCSADFDHDGDPGADADIEAFFRAIAGDICATCGSPDFDGDGDSGTDADIESFFRVLAGGPC